MPTRPKAYNTRKWRPREIEGHTKLKVLKIKDPQDRRPSGSILSKARKIEGSRISEANTTEILKAHTTEGPQG